MVDTVGIIDPDTGKAHNVPLSDLGDVLEAGGQFADDSQKQKAMALQSGGSYMPSSPEMPKSMWQKYGKPAVDYEAGLGLGMGEGLVNTLGNIANLVPEGIQKATGDDIGRIPSVNLTQYGPQSKAAQVGSTIGNPIGGVAAPGGAVFKGAKKGLESIPLISKYLPEALKTVGAGAATGGALSEDRKTGTAIGAGFSAIPGAYQAGKSLYKAATRPISEHKSAQDALKMLQKSLFEAEGDVSKAKDNAASGLNKMVEETKSGLDKSEKQVLEHLPKVSKSQAKKNMFDYYQKKKDDLKNSFNKRYESYFKQHGQKTIEKPLEDADVDSFLQTSDKSSAKMAKDYQGGNYKSSIINSSTGEPFEFNIPAKNANAESYIRLDRQLRDARAELQSRLTEVPEAEREDIFKKINNLNDFKKKVNSSLKSTLSPEEFNKYKNITEDYKNLYVPFRKITPLKNIFNKGEVSGDFLEKIDQPGNQKFYDHLLKDDEFKKSMLNWATKGKSHPLNQEASEKALSEFTSKTGDYSKLMSPKAQKDISGFLNDKTKLENLKKTLGKVKSTELDRVLKKAEVDNLLEGITPKNKKTVQTLLDDINSKQVNKSELSRKAKEAGFEVSDLEEAAKKRAKLLSRAGAGALAGGGYILGRKSKN